MILLYVVFYNIFMQNNGGVSHLISSIVTNIRNIFNNENIPKCCYRFKRIMLKTPRHYCHFTILVSYFLIFL